MENLELAVRAVQAGDTSAFRQLVLQYGGMVRQVAMAVKHDYDLAEDVAQESFLEAYRCLHMLRAPLAFPGWLKVIASRQARRLTAVRWRADVSIESIREMLEPDEDPEASLLRRDHGIRLRAAVAVLPTRLKAVAVLHYCQGSSQGEVASALSLPVGTVKKRLYDARRRMKETMSMTNERKIDAGADPERTVGLIRLLQAIESERVEEVQSILEANPGLAHARLRDRHPDGETLLHRAMPEYQHSETDSRLAIETLLLDHGADVAAPGWGVHFSDEPPLMSAAHRGHPRMVALVLSRGADPEVGAAKGWWSGPVCRPIDTAAVHGSAPVVEALIQGGARYSLAHLVLVGLTDRARAMLAADPTLANLECEGALPLHHAVTWQYHEPLLELLLSAGADPNGTDSMGRTALHVAVRGEAGRVAIPLLIGAGSDVDIFAAAGIPDGVALRRLLQADASLALRTQGDGATALAYAAVSADAEPVQVLLAAGADPDPVTPGSYRYWYADRPLTIAAQHGFVETVRLLLEAGAKPSGLPLPKASYGGHMEILELLLDNGAEIHSRDDFGRSALDWAIETNRTNIAQLLLDRGFDPANRDGGGQTALHVAAANDRLDAARVLLAHGAPRDAADNLGQTPRDVAASNGSLTVAALLSGS